MRRTYLIGVFLWFTAAFVWSQPNPRPEVAPGGSDMPAVHASNDDARTQARILEQYGKLPLSFEANHGQTDRRVKFLSRTSAYSLFLTGDEAVLTLRGKNADANRAKIAWKPGQAAPKAGGVLRMKLRNANPAAKVTGLDELAGKSNYFAGDDPAKWRPNVPTYAKVKYEEIYSGIDLVYYGNQRHLEYDFIMAPGADPHRIAFEVLGASRIRRNVHGDLVLKMGEGEIRWRKPVVYQEKDGARVEIATRYAITDTNRIGFDLAKYDASRPLYIDPLIYSTYLGGSGNGWDCECTASGIAVDSSGNAYVTGATTSTYFPTTAGAFETSCCGSFVTKINATGTALVYSTYLDGGEARGIAVDSAGDAYIVGTSYGDLPTTPGAFQTMCGNSSGCYYNAFVTEINPSGSGLVYSTYLGGNSDFLGDQGHAIAVDSAGSAYVTGQAYSSNFPVTSGAFQPNCNAGYNCEGGDAFVTKFNPAGSALVYSCYLGAGGNDRGDAIVVDSAILRVRGAMPS